MGKSGKATSSNSSSGGGLTTRVFGGIPLTIVIPLILFFFLSGIYIGSLFVHRSEFHSVQKQVPNLGLPGTNNIFKTWTSSAAVDSNNNEVANKFLRREENTVTKREDSSLSSVKQLRTDSGDATKSAQQQPPLQTTQAQPPLVVANTATDGSDLHQYSLHSDDHSFMVGPKVLDNEHVILSAWIHMDEESMHDNDMRTVFSNKGPGCSSTTDQYGVSLYVNGWQTSDHKLYVEYGGSNSGCNKLDSGSVTLDSKRWYHIAAQFSPHRVAIFLDGQVVAVNKDVTDPHLVQATNSMLVGRYSNSGDNYPFFGNISNVMVVHYPELDSTENDIQTIVNQMKEGKEVEKIKGIYAFYPLVDAVKEQNGEAAKELIHGYHGKYSFPMFSKSLEGVKVQLVDGVGDRPVTEEMKSEADRLGYERREKVKQGMVRAWSAYKKYAWGKDELKPGSNRGTDNWGGLGVTLVDSLDTLWVMGMKEEFEEAKKWVRDSLTFDRAGVVSVFETTIRELGGLLSAFDLSQDRTFLDKAKILGDKLIKAFDTRSGIPTAMINLPKGIPSNGWSGNNAILSELGTLQVEFRYLSHHTKDPKYEEISMKPLKLMAHTRSMSGLYPIKVHIEDGSFADSQVTFGALGDSFYEYLLKLWIQGGKKEGWLRDMYDNAMDGAIDKLLMTSSPSGLAFLSDWNGRSNFRKMDHLVCFMPGLLALGAYTNPKGGISSPRSQRDLAVAKALMYTCREMYHRMSTGIAPEYVEFPEGRDMVAASNANFYILRPETAESLFILNQLTGDPIYREWAWEIWEAIDRVCRIGSAYGSLRNVNSAAAGVDDRMESFFLAETMKYLYLAQDPDKPIDLMNYVFNTEAHPLTILKDHVPTKA